jgi:phage shock protein E
MTLIKKNITTLSGIILGGIAGYLYYHFIGCASGTCTITSVWYHSTLYGSVMGGLLGSMVKESLQTKK